MNNEIKEILDRLERIDHKEYCCGFEFADSGSFDEDCRCFEERKKMADYITNLQQELEEEKRIEEADLKTIQRLEEENERLKENNSNMQEEMARVWEENEELNLELSGYREAILRDDKLLGLEDYKSRCEKASELIDLKIIRLYHEVDYNLGIEDLKDIENTLQNGCEKNVSDRD